MRGNVINAGMFDRGGARACMYECGEVHRWTASRFGSVCDAWVSFSLVEPVTSVA